MDLPGSRTDYYDAAVKIHQHVRDRAAKCIRIAHCAALGWDTLHEGDRFVTKPSSRVGILGCMSHNLTLQCGCTVYVATCPKTRVAHARVIESRGAMCQVRRHEVGLRLELWELLPDPEYPPRAIVVRRPTSRFGTG
jgi:hypothetical protein